MNGVLRSILARKRAQIAERRTSVPIGALRERCDQAPPVRGFAAALRARAKECQPAVIAEIGQAGPTEDAIGAEFDPAAIARSCGRGGAACLSMSTDAGLSRVGDGYLREARDACTLPVLRRDFTIDRYQVQESRAIGADAILLVAAALDNAALANLHAWALQCGLDVLVEVHAIFDLQRTLPLPNHERTLIGINLRDFGASEVDTDAIWLLRHEIPADRLLVAAGGIATRDDVLRLRAVGVDAFVVGGSWMRAPDPGAALHDLFDASARGW